ncbi:MAG: coproporphyrinogen dehydrogenase HemZ [Clostridia bacterium]|nr:coproporphyrinogen dehydrogenase HemZ [Clostridia bacterium]
MKIYYLNNDFDYELDKLTSVFFPNKKLDAVKVNDRNELALDDTDSEYIVIDLTDELNISVSVHFEDYTDRKTKIITEDDDAQLEAALLLYDLLSSYTKIVPPWGVLTGVRPIKLFRKLKEQMGEEKACEHFKKVFLVSDEKVSLTLETEKNEAAVLSKTTPDSFSLYLSVPFCPSRCSYCSFVSASTERTAKLVEPYTQLLCKEIEKTAELAAKLGLHLESVYMGGGTPTTLSADQLKRVLGKTAECFDMRGCREFTVEAGRPDTITAEKLAAIKSANVDRISINPQTLNDSVLKAMGRRHSAEDFYRAFELARKCGFDHINTDLIAGLPSDTEDSFRATIDNIIALSPESITVHTLAMKRASDLSQNGKQLYADEAAAAAAMLSYADERLHFFEYYPYYLYRQSRMVGNLENTGWSKKGREGYYNVFIMDESQSIIACGAGAVTKIALPTGKLERIFNYKYPYEYIDRFEEVLKRKESILRIYDQSR